MELFGIGPMELILILIVALMVFGPDKLPQIGAKLGRAMRDMRRATRAISEEINTTRAAVEAPARELAEPFQEAAGAAKAAGAIAAAARNPGAALRDSVLKELNTPVPADAQAAEPAIPEEHTIAPPRAAPAAPIAQLPAAAESLTDAPTPEISTSETGPDHDDDEPPPAGDQPPTETTAFPPTYPPPEQ